jgi:hypothetical protein
MGVAGPLLQMRYYFNLVRAPEIITDQVGIELADFDRARAYVLEALTELREEDGEPADNWNGWMLEVCDVSGGVILALNLDRIGRWTLLATAMRASDQSPTLQDLANVLLNTLRRSLSTFH